MAKVVLDAGHGGYDSGASNGTRREKDDNLRMTLAVGQILKNCGVDVVYTRTTDVFVPLIERSNISNRAKADLFVSMHRNSYINPSSSGVETWVYTSPSQKALNLANNIQNNIVRQGVQGNRGVQRGNFSVLRHTVAPAALVEYGFISNTEDNALFDQKFNQYAQATADGILQTLGINCGETTPPTGGTTPPITPPPNAADKTATIKYIQNALNTRYGQNIAVDGIWGPASKRALLRAYQTELNRQYNAGLTVDGIWGPATKAASRLLRAGDRGNLVWLLQAALYVKGYHSAPDGIFGPMTELNVRNFQRANGIAVDGIAGPNTFERLFR